MTRDSTSNISLFTSTTIKDNYFIDGSKSSPLTTTITLFDENNHSNNLIETHTNREFLLFPTYAKRDPSDSSQWIVRAKGWALSHNSSTAKQKMMMGLTKSVAGKSSADRNSSQMFEERFKYFLATNKRHKQFLIQAIGITTLEESRRPSSNEQQFLMRSPEDEDSVESLNMLSTRFNHLTSPLSYYYHIRKKQLMKSFQQQYEHICFPITPPSDNDDYTEKDAEEEDDEWNRTQSDNNAAAYPADILSRPSNPISSVLDGTYFDSSSRHRKRSSVSMMDSFDHNLTPDEQEEQVEDNNNIGVQLKTKGSGFLSSQFLIPHDNILNWAQEQNQCDAKLVRIQSVCTDSNKFSPNHNIVNLIEPTGISIISDIDDTIKDTQIKAGARTVLSKTFFEDPKSVTGMADAYMAWYSQGASFHYVSNSPFQLMPMLDGFIRDSQFPPGSMHLRDDGKLLSRLVETPGQAKREAILDILRDFPHRHFVLIGDSGEIDLEIYTRIAVEHPDQILKIYIRDVTTPTITDIKKSTSSSVKQRRQRKSSGTLSSLFYPKHRSQSASEFTITPVTTASSGEEDDHHNSKEKKKFRSPLGVRRAVTTMFAEYAVEPHMTGHRSTLPVDDNNGTIQSIGSTDSEEGLIDPHRFQKISTGEACAQLHKRLAIAKQQVPHIDIILFQDAEVLQSDADIRNALWEMWDDLSNSEIIMPTNDDAGSSFDEYSTRSTPFSSSPTNY